VLAGSAGQSRAAPPFDGLLFEGPPFEIPLFGDPLFGDPLFGDPLFGDPLLSSPPPGSPPPDRSSLDRRPLDGPSFASNPGSPCWRASTAEAASARPRRIAASARAISRAGSVL
jgi:hypothetical protein